MHESALASIPSWFYQDFTTAGWSTLSWFDCAHQEPGDRWRRASSAHWLLLIVASGHISIRYRQQTWELVANEAIILPPGAQHFEKTYQLTQLARYPLVCHSDRGLSHSPLIGLPLPNAIPLADIPAAQRLMQQTAAMTHKGKRRNQAQRLLGNLMVNELLLNVLAGGFASGVFPPKRPSTADWVEACRVELSQHFRDPDYRTDELAAYVGYSIGEVTRRFKATFGMSPKEWLHHYRIVHAGRQLANRPDMTIEVIMKDCGYRSRSLFYRMFQRHLGCSPGNMRGKSNAAGDQLTTPP